MRHNCYPCDIIIIPCPNVDALLSIPDRPCVMIRGTFVSNKIKTLKAKQMKTSKMNSIKKMSILFVAMTLFTACGQNSKKQVADYTVAAPTVDLHTAVISGNLQAVRQHIDAGSDLNAKEPFGGSTPLITAATFNKKTIAQALIDAGADLSIQNNDGSTALHSAAFFCRVEIVQQLIDAKADQTLLNNFGATPRQTVMGPFEEIKPFYEMLQQQLAPMGLQLDLQEVEKTRPVIAMMLQ